ncbi:MAG: nitroreductase family deazaflavin-dependent oxidoreductase [Mycobacterium sp.]
MKREQTLQFNAHNIKEFRRRGGTLGGNFEGAPVLLLTTVGAKSGKPRTSPMMYLPDGQRLIVFASNAGADTHPAWYHNLRANPSAWVEVGTERYPVTATELAGAERDQLFEEQSRRYPGVARYQANTQRQIPVLALTRADQPTPQRELHRWQ